MAPIIERFACNNISACDGAETLDPWDDIKNVQKTNEKLQFSGIFFSIFAKFFSLLTKNVHFFLKIFKSSSEFFHENLAKIIEKPRCVHLFEAPGRSLRS